MSEANHDVTEDKTMGGVELIAAERQRQIEEEGWTPEHDDEHGDGVLAVAAACYAVHDTGRAVTYGYGNKSDAWPWDEEWDKRGKSPRLRELVKAGALIAAEIDRLQRAAKKGRSGPIPETVNY